MINQHIWTADGAKLSFQHRPGPGALLVLSHPHSGDCSTFLPLLEHWQGAALIWDRRGYGGSTKGQDHSARQEDDLRLILDHVNADRVNLLGLAAGGGVSAAFAAKWPKRVGALILVSSFMGEPAQFWFDITGDQPPQGDAAARELSDAFQGDPRAIDWKKTAARNEASGAGEPPQPCDVDLNALSTLSRLYLATGQHDLLFTPAMLKHAANRFPHAITSVFPDVAHAAPFENPQGFARWLSGLELSNPT